MHYCGFNIGTFCSDVCGDRRRPQTLAEICRNMDSCCGFRAVAAREKYPGLTLFEVDKPWWRHQMETSSALLALCAGNSPVTSEFPTQSPVTRSFDVFFHLCLNKQLSKQLWDWWFKTPSRSLWRHGNVISALNAVAVGWITSLFGAELITSRPLCYTSQTKYHKNL